MEPIRFRLVLIALSAATIFPLSAAVAQQNSMEGRQEQFGQANERVVDGLPERGDLPEQQHDSTNDSSDSVFRFGVHRGETNFEEARWGGRRYYRYGGPYGAYRYPGPYWRDYYRGGYYRPYTSYRYYGAPVYRYYNYPYRYGAGVGPLRFYWR